MGFVSVFALSQISRRGSTILWSCLSSIPGAMSVALAPSPWPTSPASRRDAGWRFGREQAASAGWRFDLRRPVVITPRRLLAVVALSSGVSLAAVAGLWWQGLGGAGVLVALVWGAACLALQRVAGHAGDRELVTLGGGELAVEQHWGRRIWRTSFRAEWVRVEPAAHDGSLVELSGEGRSVRIGRHVRPELRVELAQELRRALRLTRPAGEQAVDHDNRKP